MSFGIMSHSALCRIRTYVVRIVSYGVMSFGLLLVYPALMVNLYNGGESGKTAGGQENSAAAA